MNKTTISIKNTSLTTIVFLALLVASSMFLNLNVFVEAEVLTKKYAFVVGVLILISVCPFFWRDEIKMDKLTLTLSIFIFYLLIRSGTWVILSLENIVLICFLFLYLFFKSQNYNPKFVDVLIVFVCLSQGIYAILQYMDVGLLPVKGPFKVLGSFDNPAGLSACLAVGFPFAFTLSPLIKRCKWILFIVVLIIAIAIILSGSRTGIVSIIIVTLVYIYDYLAEIFVKKNSIYIVCFVFLLSIWFFIYLIFLKQNSAIGRLLIWNISWELVKSNMLFGGGNGSFLATYMPEQANYFDNNEKSEFGILADNIVHPFSEYLILTVEYGIFGLYLLLICGMLLLRSCKLSSPYMLSLVSLAVLSSFSYPLRYPFTWITMAYCIAQISKNNLPIWTTKFSIWSGYVVAMFSIIALLFLIQEIKWEFNWNTIARNSLSGRTTEMLPHYEKLNRSWNGNPLFLYNYGAELNYIGDYKRSINILNRCLPHCNDYDIQMLFADNYFNLGRLNQAEVHFKQASHMCPNRFVPLHMLQKISQRKGKEADALSYAHKILKKQTKIPSTRIRTIKKEMKRYLIKSKVL